MSRAIVNLDELDTFESLLQELNACYLSNEQRYVISTWQDGYNKQLSLMRQALKDVSMRRENVLYRQMAKYEDDIKTCDAGIKARGTPQPTKALLKDQRSSFTQQLEEARREFYKLTGVEQVNELTNKVSVLLMNDEDV